MLASPNVVMGCHITEPVQYMNCVYHLLQEKGLYQKILDQYEGQNSVAVREIELDLLRTLPTNKYYDRPDAQGVST